ncbi:hypothetical protein EPIR_0165 [Erwinia piriflorinigrans CFBP 5888]|uniref:Uncharacterized protein n=1 Tax=Erwinia piriflorinigrans CFBP 5888 TaxID=1161919 RepID=V5Z2S9_9GAMM|nr:hypothetical protein EPIR_0165 [Erwinia piriflorinigrans CFBP 5888]
MLVIESINGLSFIFAAMDKKKLKIYLSETHLDDVLYLAPVNLAVNDRADSAII